MSNKNSELNSFVEEFTKLNQTGQGDFARIASKLLNRSFIIKAIDRDRADYYFLCENRNLLIPYFDIIDYELVHDTANELFYIRTKQDRNRVRLNKFDTAIRLVMRQLYYIRSKELTSDNRIIVHLYEIMEKIRTSHIFSEDRKVSHYESTLKKLRTYKIIDFSATSLTEDMNIQILPSIAVIIPQDRLEEIGNRISQLNKNETEEAGGDDNENDEED